MPGAIEDAHVLQPKMDRELTTQETATIPCRPRLGVRRTPQGITPPRDGLESAVRIPILPLGENVPNPFFPPAAHRGGCIWNFGGLGSHAQGTSGPSLEAKANCVGRNDQKVPKGSRRQQNRISPRTVERQKPGGDEEFVLTPKGVQIFCLPPPPPPLGNGGGGRGPWQA